MKRRASPPFFKSSKGFSIVASLMAISLISIAALGLGTIVSQITVMVKRSLAINQAISLQSEILAALQDEKQFRNSAQLPNLRSGANSSGNEIINGVELTSSSGAVIALSGQQLGFDLDMNSCSPNSEDCLLRVDFGVQCGNNRGCRAAYRINISPKYEEVQRVPLGVAKLGNFDDNDYLIPIRHDAISKDEVENCDSSNPDVFVSGIRRDTGKVVCMRRAQNSCPEGTVAKSLTANNGRLEFNCVQLAQTRCPANYVWQEANLSQVDRGGQPTASGASGRCVYRWKNNIPWQNPWPHQKHSVSGVFCNPEVYNAVPHGGCQAVVLEQRNGVCGAPSVHVESNVSGGTVSCRIVKTEPCDAAIRAYVVWNGVCRIKVAESVAPL